VIDLGCCVMSTAVDMCSVMNVVGKIHGDLLLCHCISLRLLLLVMIHSTTK
jgi:hypothetical protein